MTNETKSISVFQRKCYAFQSTDMDILFQDVDLSSNCSLQNGILK